MKKDIKKKKKIKITRETKMVAFTYGSLLTVFFAIFFVFSTLLFPNHRFSGFNIGQDFDIRQVMLLGFVFISGVIGMYKITKKVKSKYLKGLLIFGIPTLITFLFKDIITVAVVLMLVGLMMRGIYRITPKANKTWIKILKLFLILVSIGIILSSLGYLVSSTWQNYMNNWGTSPMNFGEKGFIELQKDTAYFFSAITNLDKWVGLTIASLIFLSFATKEIIKEVIETYKPTEKEIGQLVLGTIVIFCITLILTSALQFRFKLISSYEPEQEASELIRMNDKIKADLLDTSMSWEVKNTRIQADMAISQQNFQEKPLPNTPSRTLLKWFYFADLSKLLFERYLDSNGVNDPAKLQETDNAYAEKLDSLQVKVLENLALVQSAIYNISIVLFAMFILIEMYEEISIVKTLQKDREEKEV